VQVITPPGRAGDLAPRWDRTTDLGGDRAEFSARAPGKDVSFS
jgi:hypothetical protein